MVMKELKDRLAHYVSLFLPSPLSAVVCVTLAIATLVLNQIEWIRTYLLLPDNLQVFRTVAGWVDVFLTKILGASTTNVVVVGAFWAIVGLGVYLFLRGLARYIMELDDSIEARRYVWPRGADRDRPLRVMLERTLFRLVALVLLLMTVFGPLASTLKGQMYADFFGPNENVVNLAWFLISLFWWHAVVVLLRLVLLKPRLVGDY